MTEIRCVKCGRLLMKVDKSFDGSIQPTIEIKCPKCKFVNKLGGRTFIFNKGGSIEVLNK